MAQIGDPPVTCGNCNRVHVPPFSACWYGVPPQPTIPLLTPEQQRGLLDFVAPWVTVTLVYGGLVDVRHIRATGWMKKKGKYLFFLEDKLVAEYSEHDVEYIERGIKR